MGLKNIRAALRRIAGKLPDASGNVSLDITDINSLGFQLGDKVSLSMIGLPGGVVGIAADGSVPGTWRVRNGTAAQLAGTAAAVAEPVWQTDGGGALYLGDGATSPGVPVGRPVVKVVALDVSASGNVNLNHDGADIIRISGAVVDVQRTKTIILQAGLAVGQRLRIAYTLRGTLASGSSASLVVSLTDFLNLNTVKMTSGIDDSGGGSVGAGSVNLTWTDYGPYGLGWQIDSFEVIPSWATSGGMWPYTLNVGNANTVGKNFTLSGGIAGCGAIGSSNIVSGNGSFAAGTSNILQADFMAAVGQANGQTGTANMSYSLLVGQNNRAGQIASLVHGNRAKGGIPYGYYHASESAGVANNWGTSQYERHVPCGQTADATPKDLQVGNTNVVKDFVRLVNSGSAGAYEVMVVGWSHTLQKSFAVWLRALMQKDTGGTITLVGAVEKDRIASPEMAACNVTLSIVSTHLAITVTGLAANTITWTAAAKAVVSQQVTR